MTSEKYWNTLVRALDDTKISLDTTPKDMVTLLLPKPSSIVSFSDSNLPLERKAHNRPLFIQVVMRAKKTSCVMVDDGSSINVFPLKLLHKFRISVAELEASNLIIRAYDDSKKQVVGTFKATITMGEIEYVVEFIVLKYPTNIRPAIRKSLVLSIRRSAINPAPEN